MSVVPKKRFLVTAGGSRERIDRVRDWGNIFTGNTGYRIARSLAEIGVVDLVTSNRDHQRELAAAGKPSLSAVPFVSHDELRGVLAALLATHQYDGVFMTAAVSDYQPQRVYQIVNRKPQADGTELWTARDVHADKVKSTFEEIAITGRRTEKLIDLFRGEWGYRGLLVKFKLEVGVSREKLIEIGQASRRASGADYLVANTLEMVEGEGAGAYLLSEHGEEWVARDGLPARLTTLV
jgi:phosphopantothenoylcysteine synthetase/decarboxylase